VAVYPVGDAMAFCNLFVVNVPGVGPPEVASRGNIAINRFDRTTASWDSAVLAETEPGDTGFQGPRASANGGHALLGWIQAEGGVNRVKALLQPLTATPPGQ
jgi:hypothetical protein